MTDEIAAMINEEVREAKQRHVPTPNEKTHKKRAQRKRQRDRLQKQNAEQRAQRNRARSDRIRLANWIDEKLPGVQVNREHSGQWGIVGQASLIRCEACGNLATWAASERDEHNEPRLVCAFCHTPFSQEIGQ